MKKILFLLLLIPSVVLGQQYFITETIKNANQILFSRGGVALDPTATKVYNVLSYGADPTGVVDATTAIQNACNAAYSASGKVVGAGTFLISDSIVIKSHADFSCATFNINNNAKTAVVFNGLNGTLLGKEVYFPTVIQLHSRTAGTWPGTDVGVKVYNAQSCFFKFNYIYNFNLGLLFSTAGLNGTVYNTTNLGKIAGCKVDLKLSPKNANGWINENLFLGGELACYSDDGTGVSGTRALVIDSASNYVTGNVFIKTGFEGNLYEYNLECFGQGNYFMYNSWESDVPKVKYSQYGGGSKRATQNMVIGGYNVENIVYTETPGTDAWMNQQIGNYKINIEGYGTKIAFTGSSLFDNTYPSFAATRYEDGKNVDGSTAYGFAAGYSYIKTKLYNDTDPRFQINNGTGVLSWGPGNASVDLSLMRGKAGVFWITTPPTYSDNTAATNAGLTTGMIYRTSTGVLMVVY